MGLGILDDTKLAHVPGEPDTNIILMLSANAHNQALQHSTTYRIEAYRPILMRRSSTASATTPSSLFHNPAMTPMIRWYALPKEEDMLWRC